MITLGDHVGAFQLVWLSGAVMAERLDARRGMDTGILLRNKLLMVGVEMWVKVYSPSTVGVEVVKRAERRARRGKVYYMRWVIYLSTYRSDICTPFLSSFFFVFGMGVDTMGMGGEVG